MTRVTSVHLDDKLSEKLDLLATLMDRPKAWLIQQAIKSYLDEQACQLEAITEALEDYRSCKAVLVSHEDIMQEI
jgi:predicted transcriptional regulator